MSSQEATRSVLFQGLFNQAVVSLGSFGFNLVLARALAPTEYGIAALILSVMLYMNYLHQALVTYPLSLTAATSDAPAFVRARLVAVLLTLGLQFLFFPVAFGLTLANAGASRVAPVLFALLAWQLQEVNRRGVLARGSYRNATIGDSVRYLGAFALAAVLSASGTLSLGLAFLVIALTSLLAIAATPGTQLFRRLSLPLNVAHEASAYWRLGAPILWATVLTAFFLPWFQWLLIWQHGLVAGAVLQALVNIAAIGRPVIVGLENMLVPEIARRRETMSFQALAGFLWRCGGTALLLVAPFFAAVFVAPQWTLRLVYGEHSPYVAYPAALRLLMCTYVVYLAGAMFQATLKAYGANDGVLKMQLYAAIFGVTLGSYVIVEYGLIGACLAWLGSGTLTAVFGLGYVLKLRGLKMAATAPSQTP